MIIGKNLIFRAIERDDLKQIVEWRNLNDVNKYFFEHEPLSLSMQEIWFNKYLNNINNEKVWIVQEVESIKSIGTVGVYNIDYRSRNCEWGRLFLVGDFRGKGYGKEIEKMVYRYVFEHLNMNKLMCEVYSDNVNVVEMHKKFGSKIEGILKQHIYRDGNYKDVTIMSILREDYLLNKQNGLYD